MLWRLAWRNLWRHRTRTVIVISAIVLSYALLLFFLGLQDDLERSLESTAIETAGGNAFVHAANYWETLDIERSIDDPAPVVDATSRIEAVHSWVPRLIIPGLLETATDSVAIQLTGIDVERERLVSSPEDDLVEGSFFNATNDTPLVVGRGVADRLGVTIGDRVVLTASTPDGDVDRALFFLDGITETGVDLLDDTQAWTTLEAAQTAMRMEGQLNQIGLLLDDDAARHQVAGDLQRDLDQQGLAMQVQTWDELLPDVVALMQFRRALAYLIFFALLLVVALAIANTFMMAFMERVRELGLLAALGLTPQRLFRMMLYESLLVALLGLALGFGLGLGLNMWIDAVGLDVTEFIGGDIDIGGVPTIDLVVRSHIVAWRWLASSAFVFFIVLASSLYPALRASRLSPADAMHMNE